MTEKKAGNRTRVFVYGTLKEGFGNHEYFLAGNPGVEKLGRCYVRGDFEMYTNGAFPIVTMGEGERQAPIVGEVYEVDEETLLALDSLEGHPDWYRRVKVDTPWKKAWMYVMPQRTTQFPESTRVSSGCWHMSAEEAEWMNGSEIEDAV